MVGLEMSCWRPYPCDCWSGVGDGMTRGRPVVAEWKSVWTLEGNKGWEGFAERKFIGISSRTPFLRLISGGRHRRLPFSMDITGVSSAITLMI